MLAHIVMVEYRVGTESIMVATPMHRMGTGQLDHARFTSVFDIGFAKHTIYSTEKLFFEKGRVNYFYKGNLIYAGLGASADFLRPIGINILANDKIRTLTDNSKAGFTVIMKMIARVMDVRSCSPLKKVVPPTCFLMDGSSVETEFNSFIIREIFFRVIINPETKSTNQPAIAVSTHAAQPHARAII